MVVFDGKGLLLFSGIVSVDYDFVTIDKYWNFYVEVWFE